MTMIMLSLRIMATSSTGWYALLSTCWRRTEVLRVAWRFAFVFLLNRRAHRLRMTLGCGPLKTAPLICHRPMTVNQRYCFKFHLQCLIKQDSLFATLLLWQPFIPEMNLLRQFAVITIGRKVQTTERSCWAVKRITKNQIPSQITKRWSRHCWSRWTVNFLSNAIFIFCTRWANSWGHGTSTHWVKNEITKNATYK